MTWIRKVRNYLLNCFLLLIPVFVWNIVFFHHLPYYYQLDFFWSDIPNVIVVLENLSRIIIFVLPVFFPLKFDSKTQRIGLLLFGIGILIYFSSWLMQIYAPETAWSQSITGITAPAFTPLIWLVGIGLIGEQSFLKFKYMQLVFFFFSLLFVLVHTWHATLIALRV